MIVTRNLLFLRNYHIRSEGLCLCHDAMEAIPFLKSARRFDMWMDKCYY